MKTRLASRGVAGRRSVGLVGLVGLVALGLVAAAPACTGDPPVFPPTEAGSGDAVTPVVAPTCDDYCTQVNKTCTGENRQYRDDAECKRVCAFLEPGADTDRNQNTIGCRLANAKLAQSKTTCANAGAWGGDVCGRRCETFCTVNDKSCGTLGAAAPYADRATCLEKACVFTFDPAVGDSPDQAFNGDDSLNCRSFHLVLALDNALGTHCPHTGIVSPTCQVRDAGTD